MLDRIKALVQEKDSCVLATVSGNEPHCSLMAYVADEACRRIYMVTHKHTKKYGNLMANPLVSLLIDTRDEDRGPNRFRAKALTVSGVFEPIKDDVAQQRARARLLARHPHLEGFMNDPDAQIFCVKVRSFLLLDGLTDAHFEAVA